MHSLHPLLPPFHNRCFLPSGPAFSLMTAPPTHHTSKPPATENKPPQYPTALQICFPCLPPPPTQTGLFLRHMGSLCSPPGGKQAYSGPLCIWPTRCTHRKHPLTILNRCTNRSSAYLWAWSSPQDYPPWWWVGGRAPASPGNR